MGSRGFPRVPAGSGSEGSGFDGFDRFGFDRFAFERFGFEVPVSEVQENPFRSTGARQILYSCSPVTLPPQTRNAFTR